MSKYRLAVFASGGGTTMQAIFDAVREGRLSGIEPVLVVHNKRDAGARAKALAWGLSEDQVLYVPRRGREHEAYGQELLKILRQHRIDIIGQYGWLALTPPNVVEEFVGRMINQHPGPLDPGHMDFGGRHMHGLAVHCAVLEFNRLVENRLEYTQATAHLVTPEYDKGALLGTRSLEILPGDTPESLAARLLPLEYELQIDVLQEFVKNGSLIPLPPRSERLVLPGEEGKLIDARHLAIRRYS